jgi:hypothetical protein
VLESSCHTMPPALAVRFQRLAMRGKLELLVSRN